MIFDTTTWIIAVVGLAALGLGAMAFAPSSSAGQAAKRVKVIAQPAARKTNRNSSAEAAIAKRRQSNQEALQELSAQQRASRKSRLSLDGQLRQAALAISARTFLMLSAALGLVAAFGAYLAGLPLPACAAVAIAAGLGLPRWLLAILVKRRQLKFLDQFADGIDVIVRGVKTGLPLQQCLQIVANEASEPLKSEFKSVIDGAAMGVPLHQNLARLFERMPLPEVNFFGIVLVIQAKTGGNLAEALGNLSGVLRSRKLLKEKIQALSSEAKASAFIIGSLPLIVMGLVQMSRPSYLEVLFVTPVGNLVLLGCAAMMGIGIFVMYRMVNFKY